MNTPVTLFESPGLLLRSERQCLILARDGYRFEDLDQMVARFEAALDAIAANAFNHHGLVIDLRNAPGRNDEAFETAIGSVRPRLFTAMRSVAVIVQTETGRLHVKRHMQRDHASVFITTSIEAALDWIGGNK